MKDQDVLDPLWITQGNKGLDSEYYKYILLAANVKFREKLENGDTSSFYEILFHTLNLNNLAIEGMIFDFKHNSIVNDEKLVEIREYLKNMYELPPDVITIFRNSSYVLVNLLIDYLDDMLDAIEGVKLYFVNRFIQSQRDIYIVDNRLMSSNYSVWKLRFDGRYKFAHKLSHVVDIKLDKLIDNALRKKIDKLNMPELKSLNSNKNVIFLSSKEESDDVTEQINVIANSLVFFRSLSKRSPFDSNVLDELRETLLKDRVIPFTLKSTL